MDIAGVFVRRGGDYERSIGEKTIAAGLTIRVKPTDDLAAPPEVDVAEEVEAELVKDEVGLSPLATARTCA